LSGTRGGIDTGWVLGSAWMIISARCLTSIYSAAVIDAIGGVLGTDEVWEG